MGRFENFLISKNFRTRLLGLLFDHVWRNEPRVDTISERQYSCSGPARTQQLHCDEKGQHLQFLDDSVLLLRIDDVHKALTDLFTEKVKHIAHTMINHSSDPGEFPCIIASINVDMHMVWQTPHNPPRRKNLSNFNKGNTSFIKKIRMLKRIRFARVA